MPWSWAYTVATNMRTLTFLTLCALAIFLASRHATAAPALTVLGRDYAFPNRLEGLPAKLSDFPGLQINYFTTSDGVKLAYWEAGESKPLRKYTAQSEERILKALDEPVPEGYSRWNGLLLAQYLGDVSKDQILR